MQHCWHHRCISPCTITCPHEQNRGVIALLPHTYVLVQAARTRAILPFLHLATIKGLQRSKAEHTFVAGAPTRYDLQCGAAISAAHTSSALLCRLQTRFRLKYAFSREGSLVQLSACERDMPHVNTGNRCEVMTNHYFDARRIQRVSNTVMSCNLVGTRARTTGPRRTSGSSEIRFN